jgi:lipopolysaccharide/colanic/teichoic acid biosynthesis glycosyltransferase
VQLTDLVLLAGLLASSWIKGDTSLVLGLLAACSVLTAATLVSFEAYHLGARERVHRHIYRVIGAVGGSGLFLLTFAHLIAPPERAANVLQIVDWCLTAAAVLTASHATWFSYIHRLRRQGLLTPNLMIVGATPSAQRLINAAIASRDVNILGVFDDRSGARRPEHVCGVPVLGRTSAMLSHRLLPYVDRIVVAVPPGATARIAQLIAQLAPLPNAVSLLVENEDDAGEQAAHERLLDMPLAHLAGASRGVTRAMLKRGVDLILSPGPVLFKQRRHGYLNEEVLVWKFRSMRTEASDYSASRQVTADDDRVTHVGRFIRKTSLDELPQLWNVIRGEMSLVGPRPHAIGMLTGGSEASKLVETYAHRHRMKPGLTGWAAVNGSRGPVDTPEAVRRRVSLDLEYVERQSLWLDLAIMARTLPCVLGDAGTVR